MNGLLSNKYIENRRKKLVFKFRYQQRAIAASWVIKKYLHCKDLNLIDFGTADGYCLSEMACMLGNGCYIGIEYNGDFIKSASENRPGIFLRQGDVTNLFDVKDNVVEVVTALAVLEHLEDPSLAFSEAFRILKPGGLFIITSPSPLWDKTAKILNINSKLIYDGHVAIINEKRIKKYSPEAGFEFIENLPFMLVFVGLLPCLKIKISAAMAWKIDRAVEKIKILNWAFINHCFILRKPTE